MCYSIDGRGGASDVIIPSVVQAIGVLPTDIRRTDIALNIINFKIWVGYFCLYSRSVQGFAFALISRSLYSGSVLASVQGNNEVSVLL
jgi:hypothetical protein